MNVWVAVNTGGSFDLSTLNRAGVDLEDGDFTLKAEAPMGV